MTTHNMIWPPEIIPGFDVLKWKQETQDQIYQEIKDLSDAEVVEYFRQAGEQGRKEREERRRLKRDDKQKAS